MAAIISWINEKVQLNKKVTDINKDFKNFYLYHELLKKLNFINPEDEK